ncbi:alpha/beta hydrolase [Thermaurantiacus tibetensis]|uniref:alpha/beta hydrolase n=1 Tax=Thermaurantiacus tibetensis TaxID=2759035 RepID=UPI002E2BC436|nr:alpha/beta hydrolase [Thermaurantiacus tibetensis]
MVYVREDVANFLNLLAANPQPQMHEVDPPTAREMYRQMTAVAERPAPPLARREDISVPGPAGPVPARLYQAEAPSAPAPALVYFHGGGWVIGDLETHDSLCAEIALRLGMTVVAVDYRLAPETRFPGATEDCLAAARWVAGSPPVLGHAVTGLVLAGDSAGGNLAAAVARETARELPLLAQWLIYPGVDMAASGGSLEAFAEGYLLTAEGMLWFMSHYQPVPDHPWASPLRAAEWDGLPPALVFTCGLDPLRDQGRAYAARLIETGHRVFYREAAGQIHGAMTLRGGIPSAQADLEGQIADLRALIA